MSRFGARSAGHGQGSELTVRLPVLAPPAAEPGSPGGSGEAGGAGEPAVRRRVLVADDNEDSAESLAMMLELMGNEVRVVHDGAEAVAAASEFRPGVIVLDIGMPRLNGYDACRRIREEAGGRGMYRIALSGWGQDEDRRRTEEAGFDQHFVKPVDPAVLVKLLATLSPGVG